MFAAMSGRLEIVKVLVDAGCDINARSTDGSSAVLEAALWRHQAVALWLVEHGGNLDAADVHGWTARQITEHREHEQ